MAGDWGMAMFRNEPISEVARRLNLCAEGLASEELLARSALSQARQRLGEEPMQWLFKQCANVWGHERYPNDDWNGLQLYAIDGALFRIQDIPQLREHFGSGNSDFRSWPTTAKLRPNSWSVIRQLDQAGKPFVKLHTVKVGSRP